MQLEQGDSTMYNALVSGQTQTQQSTKIISLFKKDILHRYVLILPLFESFLRDNQPLLTLTTTLVLLQNFE